MDRKKFEEAFERTRGVERSRRRAPQGMDATPRGKKYRSASRERARPSQGEPLSWASEAPAGHEGGEGVVKGHGRKSERGAGRASILSASTEAGRKAHDTPTWVEYRRNVRQSSSGYARTTPRGGCLAHTLLHSWHGRSHGVGRVARRRGTAHELIFSSSMSVKVGSCSSRARRCSTCRLPPGASQRGGSPAADRCRPPAPPSTRFRRGAWASRCGSPACPAPSRC